MLVLRIRSVEAFGCLCPEHIAGYRGVAVQRFPSDVVRCRPQAGRPGGFPVGHVMAVAGGGAWLAYTRVAAGLPTLDAAIRAVLDRARYADILRAVEQSSAAVTTTYTAVVDQGHAEWPRALGEPGPARIGFMGMRRSSTALLTCWNTGSSRLTAGSGRYLVGVAEK